MLLELPLAPYRLRILVAGVGVENNPVRPRDFERQISVPNKEVIEFVRKVFRIPMLLAIH